MPVPVLALERALEPAQEQVPATERERVSVRAQVLGQVPALALALVKAQAPAQVLETSPEPGCWARASRRRRRRPHRHRHLAPSGTGAQAEHVTGVLGTPSQESMG